MVTSGGRDNGLAPMREKHREEVEKLRGEDEVLDAGNKKSRSTAGCVGAMLRRVVDVLGPNISVADGLFASLALETQKSYLIVQAFLL